MAQLNENCISETELDCELVRITDIARSCGLLPSDVSLDKLRPLLSRICNDLQKYSSSVCSDTKLDITASGAGLLWARTSKLIPLTFDQAYKIAVYTQQGFTLRTVNEEVSTQLYDATVTSTYFVSFFVGLFKEWMRLETLPYHKKLREANRFILQEKRRYYTIFNRMSEPAVIVDHELHILETNKAFNDFFKLEGKDHIGCSCTEVLGEELCALCHLENVLEDHRPSFSIETEVVIKGQHKHIILSGTFLGDINSDFSGGILILQDTTQSKQAENALRKSEEKYRSLIENVPDVTWRANQDGELNYVSPNIKSFSGYEKNELLESDAINKFSMIHPDDVDMVRNEFGVFFASHLPDGALLRDLLSNSPEALSDERIVNGRKRYDVTYRFKKKDGSWIWVHDRASVIYEQGGEWYTDGVLSDVTELKEAEAELEKHHFRLAELVDERTVELRKVNKNLKKEIAIRKQAEKDLYQLASKLKMSNKELEEFAHVASHDLKEPLMLIMAFSKKLLEKYSQSLDERGEEYLKRIISASQRMSELIDGLLSLSRVTSAEQKYEIVDLSDLLEEVVENLEERIREAGGKIEAGVIGRLGGDRIQLRQLFQNIIANALKFRKAEKNPTVKVTSSFVGEDFCEIVFEDDGIGFEESQGERIFRPLERLHSRREFEGTGMGLATCQKIVVRHGGEIEARGVPGKGAIFIVRLPVDKSINSDKAK